MENEKKIESTINHTLYELDRRYKESINFYKHIQQAQDFYNGKQYSDVNANNMPRMSINICSMDVTLKASKICGTPIYFAFTADNKETDCTALRQFDEYNQNKMHLKESNYQAALNGYVNGEEITYIRWDKDDTSYKGIYKGGLVEEHIDPRNFAVANPYVKDIQNQQWVMFWQDVSVAALKDMLEGSKEQIAKKKELIVRETGIKEEDIQKNYENVNHALVRLYTRFFRIKGEVYFECSTESVDVFKAPHPLSKKVAEAIVLKVVDEYKKKREAGEPNENGDKILDYEIDYEDMMMNLTDKAVLSDEDYKHIKEKFSLYPFAIFEPFSQNGSFYGRSEVQSLIPIQRGINFMQSMVLMCAQNNAYNKIIAKPDALQDQIISNEPSQVLYDYSNFNNGWGLKFAESPSIPNSLLDFTDRLFQMTRVVYGFSDVMDGSVSNQDMSGYMLQQMIKQNNTAIEQQQQLFWLYNEEKAQIRLMFYKHYVDEARYTFELSDAEYEQQEQARQYYKRILDDRANGNLNTATIPDYITPDMVKNPVHKTQVRNISNKELWGVNFDISIDAMQGLADSKLVEQQFFDNLLLNGGISNIDAEDLEMYIKLAPNVSPRTKASFKTMIENKKRSEISRLKQQNVEAGRYIQQIIQYARSLEAQNGQQSNYLRNLEAEFANKINMQNKIITGLSKDLSKQRASSDGEVKSNNARGIDGTSTQQ